MTPSPKKQKKTVKAWAVVYGDKLVYKGGVLDGYSVFQTQKSANAWAIAIYRCKLDELKKRVRPCTVTYEI